MPYIHHKMVVFGRFDPHDVLSQLDVPRVFVDDDQREWILPMTSLRYHTFKKNLCCVNCGRRGTVMILERPMHGCHPDQRPHFNLYCEEGDELILMTKDHIVPRSKGGKDRLSNMQTMCCYCNHRKGSRMPSDFQLQVAQAFAQLKAG